MVGRQGADSVGSSERLYCRRSSEGRRWRGQQQQERGVELGNKESGSRDVGEPAWQGVTVAADEGLSGFISVWREASRALNLLAPPSNSIAVAAVKAGGGEGSWPGCSKSRLGRARQWRQMKSCRTLSVWRGGLLQRFI